MVRPELLFLSTFFHMKAFVDYRISGIFQCQQQDKLDYIEKEEVKTKLPYLGFFSTITQPHSILTSTGIQKNSSGTTKINNF